MTSQRYRVLAVDDNEDALELIRMALDEHYDVLTLKDPLKIYGLLDLFQPDLLILDIMMPKVTGFQLIEILQKNPDTKTIPIIILSAKDNAREIKYGYKLGASLYLTKPFEPHRLLKNVQTQFQQHPPTITTPKKFTLEKVQLEVELREGGKNGMVKLSSTLLTAENINRKDSSSAAIGGPGSASRLPGLRSAPPPAAAPPKAPGSGGPSWEG